MLGFHNKILVVDVTRRHADLEPISDDILVRTLGGKGLATHLLLRDNPMGVDPLSPLNRIIFATGPAAGSGIWGSCRHGVYTKSPLTGGYSESYSGGRVAESMATCGCDAVVIHGASKEPLWLEIADGSVFFHPAGDLWGLDTYAAEDRIKAWGKANRPDAGPFGVVCIGPAGENGVAFAVIENDYWRSAGRTGVGAVLGAKGIKAVAFHGKTKKTFAHPDALREMARTFVSEYKDSPVVNAYKTRGTPMLVDIMNNAGGFPTRYWQKGRFEGASGINADALHARCDVTPHPCLKCFMACGRLSTVKEGRHKGLKVEGPEYETIYAFGGLCMIDRIEEILFLNDICDRLGMDTITSGNLAALTIEASRQGRIDYAIDYGDVDAIAGLLSDIAFRRGAMGELLSKGIRTASKAWGMADQAIHVKGMEPAGYDPRILKGMGLAYGTSDRGACHLRTTFYKPELSGLVDPETIEGKAAILAEWEDRLTIFDTLILCRFYRDLYLWPKLSEMIRLTTGLVLDQEGLRRVAAGIMDNTRRFNLQEGLTAADDRLPPRFHTDPLPETGRVITESQMETLLLEYYRARGWDEKGIPPAPEA